MYPHRAGDRLVFLSPFPVEWGALAYQSHCRVVPYMQQHMESKFPLERVTIR